VPQIKVSINSFFYNNLIKMDFENLKNLNAEFFNFPNSVLEAANVRKPPRFAHKHKWSEIYCTPMKLGIFTIKTPCSSPSGSVFENANLRKYKIFVKIGKFNLRHMADYAMLIRKGVITEKDHDMFLDFLSWHWRTVQRILARPVVLINHNTDVPLLHFKYTEPQLLSPTHLPPRRRQRAS
tara:strand:- start:5 stop:547 length:543 start_codon:yes stop_codon:yes gene_type:complete